MGKHLETAKRGLSSKSNQSKNLVQNTYKKKAQGKKGGILKGTFTRTIHQYLKLTKNKLSESQDFVQSVTRCSKTLFNPDSCPFYTA